MFTHIVYCCFSLEVGSRNSHPFTFHEIFVSVHWSSCSWWAWFVLRFYQIHSYIFQSQMRFLLLFASLWFGCWHNLQQVANVGEECHHSRETNFKKVANSRGCLRCTLPQFLSCRNPSTASASIASSCGASIFVKRHVAPKTKSHHTHVEKKKHPSYSWSSLCNLNQGDLPLRFQALNLLASISSTKQGLDCSENRLEVATNLLNWSPWSALETGDSMDNGKNCLTAFGKNQQAKSPRAVCALPEQSFLQQCIIVHL